MPPARGFLLKKDSPQTEVMILYVRGSRVSIADSADLERYVTIDATKGQL